MTDAITPCTTTMPAMFILDHHGILHAVPSDEFMVDAVGNKGEVLCHNANGIFAVVNSSRTDGEVKNLEQVRKWCEDHHKELPARLQHDLQFERDRKELQNRFGARPRGEE